jgi:hypothetical protein
MRFTGFDYRAKGCYFITVVTHNHVCLFGHVEDGKMILNDAGKMIGKRIGIHVLPQKN